MIRWDEKFLLLAVFQLVLFSSPRQYVNEKAFLKKWIGQFGSFWDNRKEQYPAQPYNPGYGSREGGGRPWTKVDRPPWTPDGVKPVTYSLQNKRQKDPTKL